MGTQVLREEIERLAYELWIERGRPEGSPDDDWERAERLLQFSRQEPTVAESPGKPLPEVADAPTSAPVEVISGAPYSRPKQRNGGSRRTARA